VAKGSIGRHCHGDMCAAIASSRADKEIIPVSGGWSDAAGPAWGSALRLYGAVDASGVAAKRDWGEAPDGMRRTRGHEAPDGVRRTSRA